MRAAGEPRGAAMRVNRYLALCGLGGRRAVEAFVRERRVTVDGEVVADLAFRVPADAVVAVDGRPVKPRRSFRYVAYYKPRGVLTTTKDPYRRRTVRSTLPPFLRDLKPVGRLDGDTEGLLFLTDDGSFAQRVAHPSFGLEKVYEVETERRLSDGDAAALRKGIALEDGAVGRVKVHAVEARPPAYVATVTATFGRKRMIRQMFRALGYSIKSLRRVAVGAVMLDDLKPGEWRMLEKDEVAALLGDDA